MNFCSFCPITIWPHLPKKEGSQRLFNDVKTFFWNASASLAPNLLDKFVGYISSYIGALESKWPTHNGSCHVTLLYLADIIACWLRRDIAPRTLLWLWRHYWSSVTMGGATQMDLPMLRSSRLRYLWALPLSQHISHCHRTYHHCTARNFIWIDFNLSSLAVTHPPG